MERKIFEILEKMKLEVITLDEAHNQLCVLFGVIQRSEQLICRKCKSKLTDFDIYHNTCFKCMEVIKTN